PLCHPISFQMAVASNRSSRWEMQEGKKSKEQMKIKDLMIQKKMGIILFIFKSSCKSD
ncbi:unnamed protein product, partial [Rangifer tarandus platyrhynchus]